MEDATGIDLDWFWRGWFYTTDHVDLSISDVKIKKVQPKDPQMKKEQELESQKKKEYKCR